MDETTVTRSAQELNIGDVIDYGGGKYGLVVAANPNEEIAPGMSAVGAARQFGYEDFYNYDPSRPWFASRATGPINRSLQFELSFFADEVSMREGIPTHPRGSMMLARKYFHEDAVAGRVIELMAQFSVAGFRHQLKDDKVRQFYDDWAVSVGLMGTLKQVFLEYYLSANVYVMKTMINFKQGQTSNPDFKYKVDPNLKATSASEQREIAKIMGEYHAALAQYLKGNLDYDTMKTVQEQTLERTMGARKHVWSKSMVPGVYTCLDPVNVTMEGAEEFGLGLMKYQISSALKDTIINPQTADQKQTILSLPRDFVNQVRAGNPKVILDPNIVSRITRMKPDYEMLAYPLMHRAFRALHMKNRLREMDTATIDTVITQMMIIKIGSDEHPAKKAHIEALAHAWLEAQQTKTLYLFWNHTIDVLPVPVNLESLGNDKYQVWNDDIKDAFGISPVLLGRVEGAATTGYVSVKGFIENLEMGRQDIWEQFLYPEYHGIALAMGFPGFPEVIFDKFNLQDEATMKKVLIAMATSGIISYETCIEELGYNARQEIERMTKEKPLKDDGTIRVMGPQSAVNNPNDPNNPLHPDSPNNPDNQLDQQKQLQKMKNDQQVQLQKQKKLESGPKGGRPAGSKTGPGSQQGRKPRLKDKNVTSK